MGMRKVPTSRRQRRRETQDFMSRNSLGSPTFMFYPVIMMSTYTPDKTKHYLSSFSLSLFLFLSPSSRPPPSPRCRNRNSSATRKCHAFLRGEKCSSSDFHSSAFISSRRCVRMTRECLSTCFGRADLNCSHTILAQVV